MVALFEGDTLLPSRTVLPLADGASALFMPAVISEPALLGTKVVAIHPDNHRLGVPSHHGALVVFRADDGRPVALIEGSSVTAIRTAAVSALATDLLASPSCRRLAILGSGVQARSHLEALQRVREFEEVRVWSPRAASRTAFAEAVSADATYSLRAVDTPKEAVRHAEVVVTATSSPEPLLELGWLAPGAHVNAVGASTATTREIDTETVAQAALVVDSRSAALEEAGEILLPISDGRLDSAHIRSELGGVAAGREPGRLTADEITLFKSVGLAVQDLAAAAVVISRAEELGVGRTVDWS